nr:ionotropic receptor 75a-like isoform X2 [Neodiprion pinetum]
MYLSIFLTFAQLLASVTASIDQNELSNLIIDYIDYKNASRLFSAFLCLRDLDSVSLSRKIMNASISATIFNPSKICGDRESLEDLLRYNYHSINIATDLDCESSKELLMGISAGKMFNHSYSWLLTSNNKSDALAFMGGLNLSVDADVVVAITAEETVKLYDIFNTGSDRNGTLNATFIGTWRSLSPRLNIFKLQSPVYRRQNLTGITLKFAAVTAYMDPREDDPIKYLSNPANRSYDTISKINYALGVIPRDFFNYSVEISTWFDYGGRWNGTPFFGMMGALGRREADFTLGGTVVTQERLEYCTPVVQNYPFWTGFLFKHPASHSVRNVFLEPLSPSTWNAVIVLSFLVTVVLSIGTRYHRQENGNPWSFGIYSTLATLFQQGGDLRNHRCCEPRLQAPRDLKLQLFSGWHSSLPGHSGHLLFIVFTLFSMLLYNFYSASVVSSLLSDPPQNIRTIGDLLNFGMPSAYENASYVPHYFKVCVFLLVALSQPTDTACDSTCFEFLGASNEYRYQLYPRKRCSTRRCCWIKVNQRFFPALMASEGLRKGRSPITPPLLTLTRRLPKNSLSLRFAAWPRSRSSGSQCLRCGHRARIPTESISRSSKPQDVIGGKKSESENNEIQPRLVSAFRIQVTDGLVSLSTVTK